MRPPSWVSIDENWFSIDETPASSAPPEEKRSKVSRLGSLVVLACGIAIVTGLFLRKRDAAPVPPPEPAPAVVAPAPPPSVPETKPPEPEKPPEPAVPTARQLLADLDEETAGPEGKEQFRLVFDILQRARARSGPPGWAEAVDERIRLLRGKIEAHVNLLKQRAIEGGADAAAMGRERIARWGLDDVLADFEKAVVAPPPSTPLGTGVPPPVVAAPAPARIPFTMPADPPRSVEGKIYFDAWRPIAARASLREYETAAGEIRKLAPSLQEEAVRQEAASDVELLLQAGALYNEITLALSKAARGSALGLTVRQEQGPPRRIGGSVVYADRDRVEIRVTVGRETVFVEYADLTGTTLVEQAKKGSSERTLAFLCLLEGDLDTAARLLGGKTDPISPKWWIHAREARPPMDSISARTQKIAREFFYAAEREYRSPRTRGKSAERYRTLAKDYGELPWVRRSIDRILQRGDGGKELYFSAADCSGAGTFRQGRRLDVEPVWTTRAAGEFAKTPDNFVEVEFHAMADTQYRCWIQIAACCLETLGCFFQVSEHSGPHPTKPGVMLVVEPGSLYALPVKTPALPINPAHAPHAGKPETKDSVAWPWVEIPIPRYGVAGTKRIRILSAQPAFSVVRAIVSSQRAAAPADAELRILAETWGAEADLPKFVEPPKPSELPALPKEAPAKTSEPAAGGDVVDHWNLDDGAPWANSGVSKAPGRIGGGVALDGKTGYILFRDEPKLRIEGDLTLAFWVQPSAPARVKSRLVGKGEENYGVWIHPGEKVVFQQLERGGKPIVSVTATQALKVGTWVHVAAVVKGDQAQLFIQGVADGTAARTGTPSMSAAPLTFGHAGHDGYFNGKLDEVRLYRRALSAEEIKSLAEAR